MSSITVILYGVFVGVLWILARHIGYKEGFKDGYEQGEKDFKHWQIWEDGSLARAYCPNCGAKMKEEIR